MAGRKIDFEHVKKCPCNKKQHEKCWQASGVRLANVCDLDRTPTTKSKFTNTRKCLPLSGMQAEKGSHPKNVFLNMFHAAPLV